ncbi:hypothetical protein M0R45_032174 [Rubus argutus]|uniref:Uncharacterized protein n=1 Tax=Rubus argutus TaxID=59490 RepID=A0AAW1WJE1_RUBAR
MFMKVGVLEFGETLQFIITETVWLLSFDRQLQEESEVRVKTDRAMVVEGNLIRLYGLSSMAAWTLVSGIFLKHYFSPQFTFMHLAVEAAR